MRKCSYDSLNSRQKEIFNFQKLSGVLAEYGFATFRLTDDWNGADLLAHHIDGSTLRVQLKSRLTFAKLYLGKNIWVAFREKESWFLYPHDKVLKQFRALTEIESSESWVIKGKYSYVTVPARLKPLLEKFRLR